MIMLMCAFSFMAVTGFAPSVVRAGVMLAVVYSGKCLCAKEIHSIRSELRL